MEANVFCPRSHVLCHPALSFPDPFWLPSLQKMFIAALCLSLVICHLIYFCSSTLSSATGKGAGAPVMASTGHLSYFSRHLSNNLLIIFVQVGFPFPRLLMFVGLVLKPRGPNISLLANSTLKLDQKGPKGEPCLALHESCASPGL